ncbi:PREDICTED: protein RALF-like 25 [Camelina sativa]|uniref:Protein RALF-like 25 n=1 Tax=Camelina sativa TaxID=90675 RepID=A0ABM0ZCW6_CAMSA|nr:PREDICTED: protein RALF-like 25 [Camelina sativa]
MKTCMIILLVIFSILIAGGVEANGTKRKYLNLNPCSRPNPPPGCHPHHSHHKPRAPVHKYSRGCTKINRCRRHP